MFLVFAMTLLLRTFSTLVVAIFIRLYPLYLEALLEMTHRAGGLSKSHLARSGDVPFLTARLISMAGAVVLADPSVVVLILVFLVGLLVRMLLTLVVVSFTFVVPILGFLVGLWSGCSSRLWWSASRS